MHRYQKRIRQYTQARADELGRRLYEVAAAGEISDSVLRKARHNILGVTTATWRAIERGLEWKLGSIDAILAGGEPTPLDINHLEIETNHKIELPETHPDLTPERLEEFVAAVSKLEDICQEILSSKRA